jgi:hypothetical protein
VILAFYISDLLYGNNSYTVYKELLQKQENLKRDIVELQIKNASLQKEYFELKNLEQ